jgi:hypothetical protein
MSYNEFIKLLNIEDNDISIEMYSLYLYNIKKEVNS